MQVAGTIIQQRVFQLRDVTSPPRLFSISGTTFQKYFACDVVPCASPKKRVELDVTIAISSSYARRLVVLNTGHFCLTPETMHMGDEIYIIIGCSMIVALQPVAEMDHFKVVGECCVDGFAKGEAIDDLDSGK